MSQEEIDIARIYILVGPHRKENSTINKKPKFIVTRSEETFSAMYEPIEIVGNLKILN